MSIQVPFEQGAFVREEDGIPIDNYLNKLAIKMASGLAALDGSCLISIGMNGTVTGFTATEIPQPDALPDTWWFVGEIQDGVKCVLRLALPGLPGSLLWYQSDFVTDRGLTYWRVG